jgi:excinuclease UvrABC nuclease subunit
MYRQDKVVYIGASKDIRRRFSSHSIKDWDYVKIKPTITFGSAHTLEEKLISRINPEFNSIGSRRVELSTRHRITIDHELHIKIRSFCVENGFKVKDFVNEVLTNVFKGFEDAKQIKN